MSESGKPRTSGRGGVTKLMLGNPDYRTHVTDEGNQFQVGLAHAGWRLVGPEFEDGEVDVPTLLERYEPSVICVHDRRDWDPASSGSFRKDLGYRRLGKLVARPEIFRLGVVKDAGSVKDYHCRFLQEIGADGAIVYYNEQTVRSLNSWMRPDLRLIRTYHSVDRDVCDRIGFPEVRERAVVSGATSAVYPLRDELMRRASSLGLYGHGHPGYGNKGTDTPNYLAMLSRFRVHVATASRYGFALRKIIESVAMGATPVTNLPALDVLPEIDGALVRISPDAKVEEAMEAVERADRAWDPDERKVWAEKARTWYDWREIGTRLDRIITVALAATGRGVRRAAS